MKRFAIALAATAALLSAPAVVAKDRVSGEVKLAQILEGREAGKPQNCLPMGAASNMRIIDRTAIVYGHGKTVWVNRPTNAADLDNDSILVRKSHTAQVCHLDSVQLVDRTSRMYSGFIGLNEFVPYTKVAVAN